MYLVILGNERYDDTYDFRFDSWEEVIDFARICLNNSYQIIIIPIPEEEEEE